MSAMTQDTCADMNDTRSKPTIVVGVSGSPGSAAAVRWAADEADRRHGQVRVILIRSTEHRAFYAPPVDPPDWEVRQQHARDDLAATLRAALGPGPRDNLTTEIAEGMAERILIDRSARADLLVLGSAPEHPTGRVIGPVIRSCLARARCPVVVVRPEGPSTGRPANSADATRDNLELLRAGAMPGP